MNKRSCEPAGALHACADSPAGKGEGGNTEPALLLTWKRRDLGVPLGPAPRAVALRLGHMKRLVLQAGREQRAGRQAAVGIPGAWRAMGGKRRGAARKAACGRGAAVARRLGQGEASGAQAGRMGARRGALPPHPMLAYVQQHRIDSSRQPGQGHSPCKARGRGRQTARQPPPPPRAAPPPGAPGRCRP